jgi:2OG-Fe(II) oxygenase superfamily
MSGACDMLAPGLEVEGIGPIALPLLPVQAKALIAVAEPAPYGRGEETLVDVTVRRAWQIAAHRVRFTGRHWAKTFEGILARAADGLGVSEPVTAELYKLLVYEVGGFFVPHRDTEKTSGMFATLVIALPSDHTGGGLRIRHKDCEVTLDCKISDPAEAAFAAFYADCRHEVLPVTAGYRLTLIYNLARQHSGKKPEPPSYEAERTRLAGLLRPWAEAETPAPVKLIYPLEHAYTPAGLAFSSLKGADAARAAVIAPAAEKAGCDLHLALMSIEESGPAEVTGYRSFRPGRSADADDDEFDVIEVSDRMQTLSGWRRPDGGEGAIGTLEFEDEEVSPPDALSDLDPTEQNFHEATGNEGASFERTYRLACLVLWPQRGRLDVLARGGLSVSLPYLSGLAQRWSQSGEDETSPIWKEAHALAQKTRASWPRDEWRRRNGEEAQFLSVLVRLGDAERIGDFLSEVVACGLLAKDDCDAVLDGLRLLPAKRAGRLLEQIVAGNAGTLDACAALLASSPDETIDLRPAARALLSAIPSDPARPRETVPPSFGSREAEDDVIEDLQDDFDEDSDDDFEDEDLAEGVEAAFAIATDRYGRPRRVQAGTVADIVGTLDRIDPLLANAATDVFLAWPKDSTMDQVLIPAALALGKTHTRDSAAVVRLSQGCIAYLAARIAGPLAPPKDFARSNTLTCRCPHCTELGQFLADPARRQWMFRAVQHDRSHVESTIRNSRPDVDTETLRRGSPHTLICTKNQKSYEAKARQRQEDLANRAQLEAIATTGRTHPP